jgi:hypothetical protein
MLPDELQNGKFGGHWSRRLFLGTKRYRLNGHTTASRRRSARG